MSFWDLAKTVATKTFEAGVRTVEREMKDVNSAGKTATTSKSGSSQTTRKRTTDKEFSERRKGTDKNPRDFQYQNNVSLPQAKSIAKNEPGVYVLRLNGRVMKCGRAAYGQGVRWRLTQYYNLNYDARAQKGDHWSVNERNRDSVRVSWQCCPASACQELEYKLFKKYGKGEWAQRAPQSCGTNSWELLI